MPNARPNATEFIEEFICVLAFLSVQSVASEPKFKETEPARGVIRPSMAGRLFMHISITRVRTVAHLAGVATGLWLFSAGAAWAGDGADLGSLQALIGPPDGSSGLCFTFGMNPCPQLPTVTQAVLQAAGLGNNLPEMLRAQNNIPPGTSVTAGNPAAVPPAPNTPMPFPLTSSTTPSLFSPGDAKTQTPPSGLLSTLTPLAFVSQSSGTAQATQLYDPKADTFVYAVGVSTIPGTGSHNLTNPDTVYFFYEDLLRTNQNGPVVANFSFPLTVLNNDGTERAVPTTLSLLANNAGDCSLSMVTGNFDGTGMQPPPSKDPKAIGIKCAVVYNTSPISAKAHAIFQVAVPLLVTGACPQAGGFCVPGQTRPGPKTDPAYFYSLITGDTNPVNTGVYTAFNFDLPFPATGTGVLGSSGVSIGLAPSAAPLCSGGTCPTTFALCANLPDNTNGTGVKLRPAVGAYYAMATSGEMFLSAPLPSVSTSVCSLP